MEFLAIGIFFLLCVNTILHLIVWYKLENQSTPLTFLEYFKYTYDEQERLKKHMEDIAEEAREQALANYINLKDEMRRKNEK